MQTWAGETVLVHQLMCFSHLVDFLAHTQAVCGLAKELSLGFGLQLDRIIVPEEKLPVTIGAPGTKLGGGGSCEGERLPKDAVATHKLPQLTVELCLPVRWPSVILDQDLALLFG